MRVTGEHALRLFYSGSLFVALSIDACVEFSKAAVGFRLHVSRTPAVSAVNGATVTSPKEPMTVSISSAATYL